MESTKAIKDASLVVRHIAQDEIIALLLGQNFTITFIDDDTRHRVVIVPSVERIGIPREEYRELLRWAYAAGYRALPSNQG